MAILTAWAQAEVAAANGHFYIEDTGLREPADELDFSDPARWLLTMRDRLLLLSAAHCFHYVDLRVEVWDGDPDGADEDWEDRQDARVEMTEGVLEVWELAAGQPSSKPIPLTWKGNSQVRAHRAGGGAVHAAAMATDGFVHGVERFLVQLWPD